MHTILGAFFNSALLLKYLDIFLQYITGNAFILFDVTMSLFVVNCVLVFFLIGFILTVVPVCLFQSDMQDHIILELKMYAVAKH